MACFGGSDPDITQIETMNPEQKKFLNTLLDVFPDIMGGQTIGEQWGGSGTKGKPFTIPGAGGKGTTPDTGPGPGKGEEENDVPPGGPNGHDPNEPPALSQILTGPIANSYTQDQTGNYPKKPGAL